VTGLVGAVGAAAVAEATAAAAALLARADDVTVLAHVRPDADALGSALALGRALQRRGAVVRVSFGAPDTVPETLRPLDVHGLVVPAADVPLAPPVLVTCDVNEPARLGSLANRLDMAGVTVMLDHHVTNPGFGDVQILDPCAEATVVLVHGLLRAMGEMLDRDIARCLYAGLVTDTRNFRDAGPARTGSPQSSSRPGRTRARSSRRSWTRTRSPGSRCWPISCAPPSWTRRRPADSAWCTPSSRPSTWHGSARRRSTAWWTPCAPQPRPRSPRWSSRSVPRAGRSRCARRAAWTWRPPRRRWVAGAIPGPPAWTLDGTACQVVSALRAVL